MTTEQFLLERLSAAAASLYGNRAACIELSVQKTRRDFEGDFTLVTFSLAKALGTAPSKTAAELGEYLQARTPQIAKTGVEQGFLNISMSNAYWREQLKALARSGHSGALPPTGQTIMVEYSSPNTNKPLHLGHIRNNLLGCSVARILQAAGIRVIKVNLVNDRGIHICKSMLAWQQWGAGETPQQSGKKGDHLVGDYYVLFDKKYKEQIAALMAQGRSEEEARRQAQVMTQAQEMLRQWEQGNEEVRALWKTMNEWVYEGFAATYRTLGIEFDQTYYESETYLAGKDLVEQGLSKGVFYQKPDGSVWIDLTAEGLDHKLVRRADGTSVYITQDIGTAVQRFERHALDAHIYVVGSEQDYHFTVLKLILKKLGYSWADSIKHLSYGMVELPEGKMKSREGTVVDADDLLEQMFSTARQMGEELGKLGGLSQQEKDSVVRTVGLGALKYYILKVDPQKTMLFNPRESIDFNGNTGPFIQYTHARICSVLRRAREAGIGADGSLDCGGEALLADKEIALIKLIEEYDSVLRAAAAALSPAIIANYAYELAKEYNQFYHDFPVIKEKNEQLKRLRLLLSEQTALALKNAAALLGMDAPQRM